MGAESLRAAISRSTVKNILLAEGLDPGQKRGVGTWELFLIIHAAILWQAHFLPIRSGTRKGFRVLFVLVFLHVESWRTFITPATLHPNEEWICEQAVFLSGGSRPNARCAHVNRCFPTLGKRY